MTASEDATMPTKLNAYIIIDIDISAIKSCPQDYC